MKNIVWVYGTSASGKETFIKSVLKSRDLQRTFQLDGDSMVVSKESLVNLGDLDGARSSVLDEVSERLRNSDTVLIKWQYGDTLLDTPNILARQYPGYKHTIIKLTVDEAVQIQRLRSK